MDLRYQEHGDGILEWILGEHLTATVSSEFKQTVLSTTEKLKPREVIIHFAEEGYVDSAGIASLVTLQRQFRKLNASISICTKSEAIREVFFLTKLDRLFPLESDLDQTLEKLRP
ncbi:STAS domain-containing protein [bacterium]|jgi:stage II sporulation protein AA (anti-sigma F factor antagonist)|nr:STAS domain-containing protein [bacterium]